MRQQSARSRKVPWRASSRNLPRIRSPSLSFFCKKSPRCRTLGRRCFWKSLIWPSRSRTRLWRRHPSLHNEWFKLVKNRSRSSEKFGAVEFSKNDSSPVTTLFRRSRNPVVNTHSSPVKPGQPAALTKIYLAVHITCNLNCMLWRPCINKYSLSIVWERCQVERLSISVWGEQNRISARNKISWAYVIHNEKV